MKTVHVIYKTHLDIGYTDFAENVEKQYLDIFIPKAMELAEQMNKDNLDFIWTTGSWVIKKCLDTYKGEQLNKFKTLLKNGSFSYHGLAFTCHSELLSKELLEYNLSYAKKLDEEFNYKTIAAKMTDVPGHTKAIVPILAKNNIKFLHLGINPASVCPEIPPIFKWRFENEEIIVAYSKTYGEEVVIKDFDHILAFIYSNDNVGPHSKEEMEVELNKLNEKYPEHKVIASTLNNYAEKLLEFNPNLPVIEDEIGDAWIHGVGSAPQKISKYRRLLRKDVKNENFLDYFLLIPEHTWGMNILKFAPDFSNYPYKDLIEARKKDDINIENVSPKYKYLAECHGKLNGRQKYSALEQSWSEQESYIDKAISFLSDSEKKEINLNINFSDKTGEIKLIHKIGDKEIFLSENGSIKKIICNGEVIAEKINELCYKIIGENSFTAWQNEYIVNRHRTYNWADSDLGRPGLDLMEERIVSDEFNFPVIVSTTVLENTLIVKARFYNKNKNYLLPKEVLYNYSFNEKCTLNIKIKLSGFTASKLLTEIWSSVHVKNLSNVKIQKLGSLLDPKNVVQYGNRQLHAVEKVFTDEFEIENIDSPLIALGEKNCLELHPSYNKNEIHFNLFNNIWNTNFPLWCERDIVSEFNYKLIKIVL